MQTHPGGVKGESRYAEGQLVVLLSINWDIDGRHFLFKWKEFLRRTIGTNVKILKKWMDLVVTEVKIPYVYTYMYLNTYHGLNF